MFKTTVKYRLRGWVYQDAIRWKLNPADCRAMNMAGSWPGLYSVITKIEISSKTGRSERNSASLMGINNVTPFDISVGSTARQPSSLKRNRFAEMLGQGVVGVVDAVDGCCHLRCAFGTRPEAIPNEFATRPLCGQASKTLARTGFTSMINMLGR